LHLKCEAVIEIPAGDQAGALDGAIHAERTANKAGRRSQGRTIATGTTTCLILRPEAMA
jgi:hypothetical protein